MTGSKAQLIALPGQLLMPWGRPERHTVARWSSTEGPPCEAELWERGSEVGLEVTLLEPPLGAPTPVVGTIRLDLGIRPVCTVNGQLAWWNLTDEGERGPGVFSALATWVLSTLHGDRWMAFTEPIGPTTRLLVEVCEATARRAMSACDRTARATALRFPEGERFLVYAESVRDGTGRVRELAEVCPAAVSVLSWIERRIGALAADRLRAAVLAGERLARVIDLAVEVWWQWTQRARVIHADRVPRAEHETEVRATQRARWRRAPADVPFDVLISPPIDGASLSELAAHAEPRDWYELLAALAVDERSLGLEPAQRRRLAGFVSARASSLAEVARARRMGVDGLVGDMLDFLASTGDPVPCRRSAVERVIERIDAWRDGVGDDLTFSDEQSLAEPPLRRAEHGGLSLEAILTVADLRAESRRMRHCVASYAAAGVAGTCHFFRATLAGERFTVSVARTLTGWVLVEASGMANREASADALQLLRSWVSQL